jgi:hypothetical protein
MSKKLLRPKPTGSHKPFRCLIFKGLITKGDAGRFAASTTYASIRIHGHKTLLNLDSVYCANPESVAILAVMSANNVDHFSLLLFAALTQNLPNLFLV